MNSVTELIENLFDIATEYEMDQEAFWHKTISEIRLYIDKAMKRQEEHHKQTLAELDFLATKITSGVAYIMGATSEKPKTLFEYYPELFKEEKKIFDKQQQENNLKNHKMFMNNLAMKKGRR